MRLPAPPGLGQDPRRGISTMQNDTTTSAAPRLRLPMVVRGGFIVHRRGNDTSKLTTPPNTLIYEHGTSESALAEAQRLAALHGCEFAVFQQIDTALPPDRSQPEPVQAEPAALPAEPVKPRSVVIERRVSRWRTAGGGA